MLHYLNLKPLFFILSLLNIIFIKGKLAYQHGMDNNNIPSFLNEYKYCEFNDKNKQKIFFSDNNNEATYLEFEKNIIDYKTEVSNYIYRLNSYDKMDKDLLIYTNFTEEKIYYYFDGQNNREYLSTFDIVKNEIIKDKVNLSIVINSTKANGIGFIEFNYTNKGMFEVNKDITREAFYHQTIKMEKDKSDSKYYINLIPTDNNSDSYFIQLTSSLSKKEKDKVNLYYLNLVNQESIEEVIKALKNKPLKRDKKINGKIEIFAYEYSGLEEDGDLTLNYNRIKGEGIIGFITSISVLFFILIIIVIIFLKNTYS